VASPGRLTRTADLELVRREGKRVRTSLLEVRVLASLLRHHRIGVVVPRHKQSAVDRNRLKRRLRELTRTTWPPLFAAIPPQDVLLRAAPAAYAADFARLAEEVQRLGQRVAREAA
jgi:ribonuclease P protein component